MLQKETIEPGTLELLKQLQHEPLLQSFNLVGGTALALRMGHRKSIDLDLFTREAFDLEEVTEMLVHHYGMKVTYARKQTLKGFIDGIKIDCIRYDYPHLNTPDTIEEIRLESVPDIIAMKLSAIAHNGSRIKDYIDSANLSTHYSFNTMLEFYTAKFDNANPVMPIKAITYYGEIDFNEPVVMLTDEFDWNKIASRLEQMVAHPDKVFDRRP